jgi:hypothetical protein
MHAGRASTDRRARGVSDRGGGRTDRAGPAPGDLGAGRACAKRYPEIWAVRSGLRGGDQTKEGRMAAGDAAPLRGGEVVGVEAGVS